MGWTIKRKNGVFQGIDFGTSSRKPSTRVTNVGSPSNSYAYSDKTGGRPYSKTSVSVKAKPRKNGVYQGVSVKVSKDKGKIEEAAKNRITVTSPSAPPSATKTSSKTTSKDNKRFTKSVQEAASKRAKSKMQGEIRKERIATGSYKGKYMGPDEFKGNEAAIKRWKAAGGKRSDIKKFAKG
jgi:hypothetical protein